jgi:hypothetical protein
LSAFFSFFRVLLKKLLCDFLNAELAKYESWEDTTSNKSIRGLFDTQRAEDKFNDIPSSDKVCWLSSRLIANELIEAELFQMLDRSNSLTWRHHADFPTNPGVVPMGTQTFFFSKGMT